MHAPFVWSCSPLKSSSSCSPLDDEFFLFAPQIKDKTSGPDLTCTTDSRPRDTHEPTDEPESLWGTIDPKSFVDRAFRGKPPELDEKLQKARGRRSNVTRLPNPTWPPDQAAPPSRRERIDFIRGRCILAEDEGDES
jgi:hypothetical protein